MKKMRIQMDFLTPVLGADLIVDVFGSDPLGATTFYEGGSDLSELNTFHYFDFVIYPNPDWENIFIANQADPAFNPPSFIEIDTISIPEPATLGLLA